MQYYHDLYNDKFYNEIIFNKNYGYFVEIGALDGKIHSQSYFFEKILKWDGIIVEPHPMWHNKILESRTCKLEISPISNKSENDVFICRQEPAFSSIKKDSLEFQNSPIVNEFEIRTLTLTDLLDKYNAPNVIDFISIDVEGSELKILEKFFEDDKYSVNLINFEHYNYDASKKLMSQTDYIEIKNPFLDFIRIGKGGLVKLNTETGLLFYGNTNNICYESYLDLSNIQFEHYYIHMDFLKKNKHLKRFIK
jgi:FkbM family methyltransferase